MAPELPPGDDPYRTPSAVIDWRDFDAERRALKKGLMAYFKKQFYALTGFFVLVGSSFVQASSDPDSPNFRNAGMASAAFFLASALCFFIAMWLRRRIKERARSLDEMEIAWRSRQT